MSTDLRRLESASGLRTWEEGRVRDFNTWRSAVDDLIAGLRAVLRRGSAQSRGIDAFLRHRTAAEAVFAQTLIGPVTPLEAPADGPFKEVWDGKVSPSEFAGSFLEAIMKLQNTVASARATFASSLQEGNAITGVSPTTTEFEKKGATLLAALEAGCKEVVKAHEKVREAMSAYHRASIEGRRRSSKSSSDIDVSSDAWLQEHRYRRVVAMLQDRQRQYTTEVCNAIKEARALEEWRSEMSKKILGRYCTKLFQVETAVQSYANDGVRALANNEKEPISACGVIADFNKLLKEAVHVPAEPPAATQQTPSGSQEEAQWPALQRLWSLTDRTKPHPTVLCEICGPLEVRRWYNNHVCGVVLTKDYWLHCFHMVLDPSKPKKLSRVDAGVRNSEDIQDVLELEPQWSIFTPAAALISPLPGKPLCFEIEEVRRGFLGMGSRRKEMLQAGTTDELGLWTASIRQAQATSKDPSIDGHHRRHQSQPPPPPPPRPPPPTSGQNGSASEAPAQSAAPAAAKAISAALVATPAAEPAPPAPVPPTTTEDAGDPPGAAAVEAATTSLVAPTEPAASTAAAPTVSSDAASAAQSLPGDGSTTGCTHDAFLSV